MSGTFGAGVEYFFKGMSLIHRRGLRRYVLIPLLLNILIFSGLIGLSAHFYGDLISWIDSLLPSWLHWLNWLLWLFFATSIFLVFIYTFTLVANLVSAPFNSFLAEKTEMLLTGKKIDEAMNWKLLIKDIGRSIQRQWQIIVYYIPRVLLLLILFFVPGVNLIATIAWFLFSAHNMAIQYIDYPMDLHRVSFRDMLKQLKNHRKPKYSFGAMIVIFSLIPLLNLLVMPIAVCGSVVFYLEECA